MIGTLFTIPPKHLLETMQNMPLNCIYMGDYTCTTLWIIITIIPQCNTLQYIFIDNNNKVQHILYDIILKYKI